MEHLLCGDSPRDGYGGWVRNGTTGNLVMAVPAYGRDIAGHVALERIKPVHFGWEAVVSAYLTGLRRDVAVDKVLALAATGRREFSLVMVVAESLRFMWSLAARNGTSPFRANSEQRPVAIPATAPLPNGTGAVREFLAAVHTGVNSGADASLCEPPTGLAPSGPLGYRRTAVHTEAWSLLKTLAASLAGKSRGWIATHLANSWFVTTHLCHLHCDSIHEYAVRGIR